MSETGKLINLPDVIWEELQTDASRCLRNVTKQIEAIFVIYFELGNPNIGDLTTVREQVRSKIAKAATVKVNQNDREREQPKRSDKLRQNPRRRASGGRKRS